MRIEYKKRKKSLFERIFKYPTFSFRFWFSSSSLIVIALIALLVIIPKISTWDNRLTALSLAFQCIALIFGIIATFFALTQLTESRFSKLEEIGLSHLKNMRYFNAISSWKEALYIKRNSTVFFNLAEAFLIAGQIQDFDEIISCLEKKKSFQKNVLEEPRDYMIFYYLRVFRALMVENMGVAKNYLNEMVDFVKKENFQSTVGWTFDDITRCEYYKKMVGDHKVVADNLIKYLDRKLVIQDRAIFESNDYLFVPKTPLIQNKTLVQAKPPIAQGNVPLVSKTI